MGILYGRKYRKGPGPSKGGDLRALCKANKISIMGVEGKTESGWILVDCGEVVVNIMKNDIREFYDLEGLWGENTLIDSSK